VAYPPKASLLASAKPTEAKDESSLAKAGKRERLQKYFLHPV